MNSSPVYSATYWNTQKSSFISDGVSTISSISVYYYKATTYLYSLQVTDSNGAVKGTQVPNFAGASGSLAQTITVAPPVLLKTFKVWAINVAGACGCATCRMITQMEFIFSDGSSQTVSTPNFVSTNTLYSFASPVTQHIVGFYSWQRSACDGYNSELQIYYRYI